MILNWPDIEQRGVFPQPSHGFAMHDVSPHQARELRQTLDGTLRAMRQFDQHEGENATAIWMRTAFSLTP